MHVVAIKPDTSPDQVLENAKGCFSDVVIIGWDEDELIAFSSDGMTKCADIVYLLEKAKDQLIRGLWS